MVAVLVVVAFLMAHLLQVVGDPSQQEGDLGGADYPSFLRRLMDAVPMPAIKFVVVVWQIVSQVSVYGLIFMPYKHYNPNCISSSSSPGDIRLTSSGARGLPVCL